jgi:hypothetical protein
MPQRHFFLNRSGEKCRNGISSENNMKKRRFGDFFHKGSEKNAETAFFHKIV